MVHRHFWLKLLERAWRERSVVWLTGVRRVGKTCLCQDLPGVEYFDCELPRIRRMLLDPQSFLDGLRGKRVVLDEIHRHHLGNVTYEPQLGGKTRPDLYFTPHGTKQPLVLDVAVVLDRDSHIENPYAALSSELSR